jgi:hypothetical protein
MVSLADERGRNDREARFEVAEAGDADEAMDARRPAGMPRRLPTPRCHA